MINTAALALEGGALRGIYTAGVLDVLMEEELWFPCVVGVSAGSLNGINYVSHQPGRSARINLEYINDERYLSYKRFFRRQGIFGFDFLFGELSRELLPLDWKTFKASEIRYFAVATSCHTGKPVLFEKGKCADIMAAAEASCSMPVFCRPKYVEGEAYLDGGVSLSIPVSPLLKMGYTRPVAVLTRQKGYRKKPLSSWMKVMYHKTYGKEPELLQALLNGPDRYNREMEMLDRMEQQGQIFLIRPSKPVTVSRLERDTEKLRTLYQEGRSEMQKMLPNLKKYLSDR